MGRQLAEGSGSPPAQQPALPATNHAANQEYATAGAQQKGSTAWQREGGAAAGAGVQAGSAVVAARLADEALLVLGDPPGDEPLEARLRTMIRANRMGPPPDETNESVRRTGSWHEHEQKVVACWAGVARSRRRVRRRSVGSAQR